MSDFLDSLHEPVQQEPNVEGSFECQTCRETVHAAYYDRPNSIIKWWCSQGHESVIKEFGVG